MLDTLTIARQRVTSAEDALYVHLHTRGHDQDRSRKLAEDLRVASDELLDQLSKYCPEKENLRTEHILSGAEYYTISPS